MADNAEEDRSYSGELIQVHTSGHIFVEDIGRLIRKVNPGTLVPIQTFEPEYLQSRFQNVVTIRDGETLEL